MLHTGPKTAGQTLLTTADPEFLAEVLADLATLQKEEAKLAEDLAKQAALSEELAQQSASALNTTRVPNATEVKPVKVMNLRD